jgi:hypothetical protein
VNLEAALFFEEIVEGAASVRRLGNSRMAVCTTTGVPRFAFDGGSRHEKLAFVAQIFLGDADGDGLGAFKLS